MIEGALCKIFLTAQQEQRRIMKAVHYLGKR